MSRPLLLVIIVILILIVLRLAGLAMVLAGWVFKLLLILGVLLYFLWPRRGSRGAGPRA